MGKIEFTTHRAANKRKNHSATVIYSLKLHGESQLWKIRHEGILKTSHNELSKYLDYKAASDNEEGEESDKEKEDENS